MVAAADPDPRLDALQALATARHELSNPLAIVMAQAELLELEATGTPFHDRAARIRAAAQRAARVADELLATDGTRITPVAATGDSPPAERTRTALVIDDEPELADSLADCLRVIGFTATAVTSGAAAQALLIDSSYDLIVSDLRMPDIDGPALFAWLAQTRPALVATTAFSTGDTLSADAARFLGQSGRPYMEKPFTLAAVRALVDAVAAGRGR